LRRTDEVRLPVQLDCAAFVDPATHLPQCRMTVQNIGERQCAQQQLRATSERMQLLSRRLVELQENERHNLARELHDQIGQALTAIQINLQRALAIPNLGEVQTPLFESLHLVDSLVEQTQNLSLGLRPALLDDLGLESALRWLADWQATRAALRVEVSAEDVPKRLDPAIATACFRVAQESLTNVLRHAAADAVRMRLWREDHSLHLLIQDDGCGFDYEAMRRSQLHKGLGLLGMEERVALAGGILEVRSSAGKGTKILARFPPGRRTTPC
jgi:signal transduction histidine kinase